MAELSVRDALKGERPPGSEVTVEGWVRTRRDSKQGFSFIALHDGSCFDAIQIVCDGSLQNYASEVLKITTGCEEGWNSWGKKRRPSKGSTPSRGKRLAVTRPPPTRMAWLSSERL